MTVAAALLPLGFAPGWLTLRVFARRGIRRRVYRPPARVGLPPLVTARAIWRCIAPLADLRPAGMR
jgi:hypothetical protein